eukprot:8490392-Pyramimonas_sp.AAC.2
MRSFSYPHSCRASRTRRGCPAVTWRARSAARPRTTPAHGCYRAARTASDARTRRCRRAPKRATRLLSGLTDERYYGATKITMITITTT